ncbi:nucleotidyltransferase domain-containing protein [Synergistaceae bacterium OttesenSCG-928-I11]|nr:nucleotidyltransferase domain-containing protein [Synergistaceae bacterium OttesenSCG-928-I11]
MIEKNSWTAELLKKLREAFGPRLLFMGLQGSYRRNEATETSDIDVVTVLDALSLDDLDTYRKIVKTMPEGEKACGFIAGREELRHWPKFEIFQLVNETEALHGRLDGLVPDVTDADVAESVKIGASALYHALCHTYLYGDAEARAEVVRGAYKGAFFLLQTQNYLRTGVYADTRKKLLPKLEGDERRILETRVALKDGAQQIDSSDTDAHFDLLIRWCGVLLVEV